MLSGGALLALRHVSEAVAAPLFGAVADRYGAAAARFDSGGVRSRDDSSSVIAVNHEACILCDLCIRACNDLQSNEVLGRSGKGYDTHVAFDLDAPMGQSSCVSSRR